MRGGAPRCELLVELLVALALLLLLPGPAATLQPHAQALNHIKANILAKLGLTSRPTPKGAPPRDVVRQILARAADPQPEQQPQDMREIIAIAHKDKQLSTVQRMDLVEIFRQTKWFKAQSSQLATIWHN